MKPTEPVYCMCCNNGLLDRRLLLVQWEAQQRRRDIRKGLFQKRCSDLLIHCDYKLCWIDWNSEMSEQDQSVRMM